MLLSGEERLTIDDVYSLSDLVATAWMSGADRDWSVPAGPLEWSCTKTADHAVDCVYAPAFFLASRELDGYPAAGGDLSIGPEASPAQLVGSLWTATRMLVAVVKDARPDDRAVIFQYPEVLIAGPQDFLPRGAMELIPRRLQRPPGPVRAFCRALLPVARAHAPVADVDHRLEWPQPYGGPVG